MSMGVELWVFSGNTAVKEITHGWRVCTPIPQPCSFSHCRCFGVQIKVWPADPQHWHGLGTCWKYRISGSTPYLLGQNLHFKEAQDSQAQYHLRSPDAELTNFCLLIDSRICFLTLISCIRYLHTRGNYTAIQHNQLLLLNELYISFYKLPIKSREKQSTFWSPGSEEMYQTVL